MTVLNSEAAAGTAGLCIQDGAEQQSCSGVCLTVLDSEAASKTAEGHCFVAAAPGGHGERIWPRGGAILVVNTFEMQLVTWWRHSCCEHLRDAVGHVVASFLL